MGLTFKQKLQVFRIWLKVPLKYKFSTIEQIIALRRKVKEWSEDWKAQGYQVDREEETVRLVRLGKAHGLLRSEVEVRRLEQVLQPYDHLITTPRRRHGKAR